MSTKVVTNLLKESDLFESYSDNPGDSVDMAVLVKAGIPYEKAIDIILARADNRREAYAVAARGQYKDPNPPINAEIKKWFDSHGHKNEEESTQQESLADDDRVRNIWYHRGVKDAMSKAQKKKGPGIHSSYDVGYGHGEEELRLRKARPGTRGAVGEADEQKYWCPNCKHSTVRIRCPNCGKKLANQKNEEEIDEYMTQKRLNKYGANTRAEWNRADDAEDKAERSRGKVKDAYRTIAAHHSDKWAHRLDRMSQRSFAAERLKKKGKLKGKVAEELASTSKPVKNFDKRGVLKKAKVDKLGEQHEKHTSPEEVRKRAEAAFKKRPRTIGSMIKK